MLFSENNVSSCIQHEVAALAPIGVFDSGIGGLSVLRALIKAMPARRFIYMADTGYAPYGERNDEYIIDRSHEIAHWMHETQNTAGLVIACNTATAAAAKSLRQKYGQNWRIIGVEPGLKPAAVLSQTGRIAIMATASTLQSEKFQKLISHTKESTEQDLTIFSCPCNGLAKAIEDFDEEKIEQLISDYTSQVKASKSDVVALGCTHYCLLQAQIEKMLPGIQVLDTGEAIAKHAASLFTKQVAQSNSISSAMCDHGCFSPQPLQAWSTGDIKQLENAIARWLPDIHAQVNPWHGNL